MNDREARLRRLEAVLCKTLDGAGRRCEACGGLTAEQVLLALAVTEGGGSSARMNTATAKQVLHEAARCTETCACGGITLYGAFVTHQHFEGTPDDEPR